MSDPQSHHHSQPELGSPSAELIEETERPDPELGHLLIDPSSTHPQASHPRHLSPSSRLLTPTDEQSERTIQAWFPRAEAFTSHLFAPLTYHRRPLLTYLFLTVWILTNLLLARQSWYVSQTSQGEPVFLGCTDTFWSKDGECGLDGELCKPFENRSFAFRCPGRCASVKLFNPHVVGGTSLHSSPLVIGHSPYRSDSWICQAGIHAGLISDRRGGCGVVSLVGESGPFLARESNGIGSVGFEPTFPSAFKLVRSVFWESGCEDLWVSVLSLNLFLSLIFVLVIQPPASLFFWVLVSVGYWTIVFGTDPNGSPPRISQAIGDFLPYVFVCYALWRVSWRHVLSEFNEKMMSIERLVWYLPAWWIGVLLNLTAGWIPINRLILRDLQQEPFGLFSAIILALLVLVLIGFQAWELKKAHQLTHLIKCYAITILFLCLLTTIPGYTLRMHHYCIGILLTPMASIPNRASAVYQAFLLGMLQNGIARWSFGSILEQTLDLIDDGHRGGPMPRFIGFDPKTFTLSWETYPSQVALLVDDVLVYVGDQHHFSLIKVGWVHYFRLAFVRSESGQFGDFTSPATFWVKNSTFVPPSST